MSMSNFVKAILVLVLLFLLHLFFLTRDRTVPISQYPLVLTSNYIQTKYAMLKGNLQQPVRPIHQVAREHETAFVFEDDTMRRSMLRQRINRIVSRCDFKH